VIFKSLLHRFAFSDNLVEDINVANVEFLRRIVFEFNGTLTAAGGTTDATLREDGLLNTVLKRLEMKADGSDPFVDSNGRAEYWRRAILSGSPGVLNSVIPTGAASTAQRVHVVLDMDEVASAARFAGRIDARRLSSLDLRVTAGAVEADMVTGGDRTETMTGTLEVYAVYDDGNDEAGAREGLGYKGGGRRIAQARHVVTAANQRAELPLPADLLIGKILLIAVDNGVRDNDILNDVTFKLGEREFVRADVTWEDLQSSNVEDYGLELAAGLPPYTGVAIVEFDMDGDMAPRKVLNTVGLRANAAKILLDVNAPTGTSYIDMFVYGLDTAGVGRQKTLRR
jgi:hypothetical protein